MGESIYLTDDELIILTGCKQKKPQITWLEENHIQHFVNKLGKPIVIRNTFTGQSQKLQTLENQEPNFGALNNGTEAQRPQR